MRFKIRKFILGEMVILRILLKVMWVLVNFSLVVVKGGEGFMLVSYLIGVRYCVSYFMFLIGVCI